MHPLTNVIGQPTNRKDVPGAIEGDAIVEAKALAGEHLTGNGVQIGIIGLERMALGAKLGCGHLSKDKPIGCDRAVIYRIESI
jgi:hypothetical protein